MSFLLPYPRMTLLICRILSTSGTPRLGQRRRLNSRGPSHCVGIWHGLAGGINVRAWVVALDVFLAGFNTPVYDSLRRRA